MRLVQFSCVNYNKFKIYVFTKLNFENVYLTP